MIRKLGFIGKIFKRTVVNKQPAAKAMKVCGTKVSTSLETGSVYMERSFKGNLYKTEVSILSDGTKKYSTKVYGSNGEFIGKGGNEGLAVSRTSTIQRIKDGSILGGDQIKISKKWDETMGMTEHNIDLIKDYDSKGVMHHMEGTKKYRHWEAPQTASIDKTFVENQLPHSAELLFNPKAAAHNNYKHKVGSFSVDGVRHSGYSNYDKFASEGTTYSKAVESKKAAEAAAAAEREAKILATQKAEQEAAEALKAIQPRVNTGKVFNKNIEEFKCIEETRADGSIVRRYVDPMHSVNGKSNPMITTIDKGNYHEEIIYDPIKNVKISYKQLGKEEPTIEMQKGFRHKYVSKMAKHEYDPRYLVRKETQVYDDGLNYVEFESNYPERFKVNVKNPYPEANRSYDPQYDPDYIDFRGYGHVGCRDPYRGQTRWERAAEAKLAQIRNEVKNEQVDLMDLFQPYQP